MFTLFVGCNTPLPAHVPATQRIRHGKELQEAKRKEEEGAMRRMIEERKREKAEEARARCGRRCCSSYSQSVVVEDGGSDKLLMACSVQLMDGVCLGPQNDAAVYDEIAAATMGVLC